MRALARRRVFTAGAAATGGGPPAPAAFPSRLRVAGGKLVDANSYDVGRLPGGSIHVAPLSGPTLVPSQAFLDDIASKGAKLLRAICQWGSHESTQGVWNTTAQASLDTFVSRCETAGLQTMLELHLNVPGAAYTPSWATSGADQTAKYATYGQFITQAMAERYGANPVVVGFGLNETPIDVQSIRDGSQAIPYLEGVQRQMISWFRAAGKAPDWVGFVTLGYANQTPYLSGNGNDGQPRVSASPTAYAPVGSNVALDVHCYFLGCNNGVVGDDGRQGNGTIYPTYQSGGKAYWATGSGGLVYPTGDSTRQSQLAAFYAPYATYCAAAGMPLMVGEVNWDKNNSGKTAWWADMRAAMANAGVDIAMTWILADTAGDVWESKTSGVWDPEIVTLLGNGW